MNNTWSKGAWKAITPIFEDTLRHPFLAELMRGTLAREKFLHYLNQDALYLDDFGKVLAGIAVKCRDREQVEDFLAFASDSIAVERALHLSYLGQLDAGAAPTPTCLLYTSYLQRQLATAPLEVAAAAVLPCFWIYQAVGDFIISQRPTPGNPYQDWINTYGGDEFAKSVIRAIAIVDALAEGTTEAVRWEMTRSFVLCTRMEWMFWDAAWRLEGWPRTR